jgi:hypothetical protein
LAQPEKLEDAIKLLKSLTTQFASFAISSARSRKCPKIYALEGSGVQVNTIPLTSDKQKNTMAIRNKVYKLAFRPIRQRTVEAGKLADLPESVDLLEQRAALLPGQGLQEWVVEQGKEAGPRTRGEGIPFPFMRTSQG